MKSLRLRWLGHLQCMETQRTPKSLLAEIIDVRRRPRMRWFQNVKNYLRHMRIEEQKEQAQNQDKWRLIMRRLKFTLSCNTEEEEEEEEPVHMTSV